MAEQSKSPSRPSKQQLYQRGILYDAIARLLPLEGRDFTVELEFNPTMRARVTGKTEIGVAFAKLCQEQLRDTMQAVASENTPTPPSREEMMQAVAKAINRRKGGHRAGVVAKPVPKGQAGRAAAESKAGAKCGRRATAVPPAGDTTEPGEQLVL